MKTLFQFMAGGVCGLFAACLFWLAVEIDNAELQVGKSPHSGFTPDCPDPMKFFDGLDKPSRTSRFED